MNEVMGLEQERIPLLTLDVRLVIRRKFPYMLGDALIIRVQFPRLKSITGETLVKKNYKGRHQVIKVFLNHSTV